MIIMQTQTHHGAAVTQYYLSGIPVIVGQVVTHSSLPPPHSFLEPVQEADLIITRMMTANGIMADSQECASMT